MNSDLVFKSRIENKNNKPGREFSLRSLTNQRICVASKDVLNDKKEL